MTTKDAFAEVQVKYNDAVASSNFMPLAMKLVAFSKTATTNVSEAEMAITNGAVPLLLQIVCVAPGAARSGAMKALGALLCRPTGLTAVEEAKSQLLSFLYHDLTASNFTQQLYALDLMCVLVDYFPDSFELVDVVAKEVASTSKQIRFAPLIPFLTNKLLAVQKTSALLLCLLGEKAAVKSPDSLDAYLQTLKQLGVAKIVATAKQSGPIDAPDLSESFCQLELMCADGPRGVKFLNWQLRTVHEQLARSSGPNIAARAAALAGMAKIAGVPTDEAVLAQVLVAHLRNMEQKILGMTSEQQAVVAKQVQAQQVEMEARLQEQRAYFEQKLVALSSQPGLSREKKNHATLSLELEELKRNQELLMEEHNKNQASLDEQNYLRQHKQLFLFYQSLQHKLNEMLLGYKVLASGLVTAEKGGVGATIECAIALCGDLIPFPGVSTVTTVLTKSMEYFRTKAVQQKAKQVSGLAVSISAIEYIAEHCARDLSFRYESQVRQLELEGARRLAECAVRRMVESMRAGCLNALEEHSNAAVVDHLVSSIVTVDKRPGTLAIKHQEIPTLVPRPKKHRWHEANVFKKPGVKTLSGEYFSGPSTDVSQYGYRIGTAEEAKALGCSPDHPRKAALVDSSLMLCYYHTFPKVKSALASRLTPAKGTVMKPPKPDTAAPPIPTKRLFGRRSSVSRSTESLVQRTSTESSTTTPSAKRRDSKAEILMFELVEEVEKACLVPPADIAHERAVSPMKLEAAVGPSPMKAAAAIDPAHEIAELKQRMAKMEEMMATLMAQNAQLLAQNAQLLKRNC